MTSEQAIENGGRLRGCANQLRNSPSTKPVMGVTLECDNALSLVMRAQIFLQKAEIMVQNCNLEAVEGSHNGMKKSYPILSFESDCLPFGTPVLVLAR